jgi:hypothetical protein
MYRMVTFNKITYRHTFTFGKNYLTTTKIYKAMTTTKRHKVLPMIKFNERVNLEISICNKIMENKILLEKVESYLKLEETEYVITFTPTKINGKVLKTFPLYSITLWNVNVSDLDFYNRLFNI